MAAEAPGRLTTRLSRGPGYRRRGRECRGRARSGWSHRRCRPRGGHVWRRRVDAVAVVTRELAVTAMPLDLDLVVDSLKAAGTTAALRSSGTDSRRQRYNSPLSASRRGAPRPPAPYGTSARCGLIRSIHAMARYPVPIRVRTCSVLPFGNALVGPLAPGLWLDRAVPESSAASCRGGRASGWSRFRCLRYLDAIEHREPAVPSSEAVGRRWPAPAASALAAGASMGWHIDAPADACPRLLGTSSLCSIFTVEVDPRTRTIVQAWVIPTSAARATVVWEGTGRSEASLHRHARRCERGRERADRCHRYVNKRARVIDRNVNDEPS